MSIFNKSFNDKKNNKRNNSFKDFYNNIIFNNEKFNKNNNNNIFKNSDNKKFNFNIFFNNNNKHNLNRPFTQNLNDKFNVKKNYFSNNNNNNFYSTLFHFPSLNNSFFENKKIEDDYVKLTNNFENNVINKKDTNNHFDINNFIKNTENNENIIENNNNNNKENNVNNNINNNYDKNNIKIENNNINNNNSNNNNNCNSNNNNNNFINNNNNIINNNNNNFINNNNKNTKNDFLKNNLFRPYKSKIPIAQNFNTYLYKTNLSYRNYINSNNKMYNSYLTKQNIKNNLTTFFKNNNSTLTPNISTLTHNDFNISNMNNNKQKNNKISSYNTKSIKNITKNINFKINYSSLSKAGCSIAGIPKTNQDNYYTQSSKITNSYFEYTFGVFDGHGSEGHLVSQTLKSFFEIQPFTNLNSKENLKSTFNQLSNCINNTKNINFFISGSTCVLVHISNKKIICGNVGDSRAIVFYDMNNNLIIKNLSFDHKPENFEEKKRIEKMGGRVERIYNDLGPFRVWFKNENFPGLAMSRSFGDKAAHSVGVIDEPDIIEMDVVEDEGKAVCVIVASDGVWEFVGNESLKEIVGKYVLTKNAKECVNDIVQKSRKMWEKSGFAIDDITCVVGFFEYDDDEEKFNINEEKNI